MTLWFSLLSLTEVKIPLKSQQWLRRRSLNKRQPLQRLLYRTGCTIPMNHATASVIRWVKRSFSVGSKLGFLRFFFISLCDWSRKLVSLSRPIRFKLKLVVATWSLAFSHASGNLLVLGLIFSLVPCNIFFSWLAVVITLALENKFCPTHF